MADTPAEGTADDETGMERRERKLDGESTGLGTLAALIFGFSLSLIPGIERPQFDTCSCSAWSGRYYSASARCFSRVFRPRRMPTKRCEVFAHTGSTA